eukprot:1108887-Alexandrium_andersonii.AAC.1
MQPGGWLADDGARDAGDLPAGDVLPSFGDYCWRGVPANAHHDVAAERVHVARYGGVRPRGR